MQKINRLVIFVTALLMFGALDVWAQPGGGRGGDRGGGDRGGRRGAMMALRSVPVEQILGFLAFDEKVALNLEQLGKVRDALKAVHSERANLVKKLAGGDRETAMTEVRKLRAQMTQKLSAILKPDQVKALKAYMQNMNQRGGRGGQEGRGGGQRRPGGDRRGGGGA